MDGILILVVAGLLFVGLSVSDHYDIREYFDKPYCEEVMMGRRNIKKCWEVREVK